MKNLAHERFILEMILHGDRIKAYKAVYPNCTSDKAASANACRLLRNKVISTRIEKAVISAQRRAEREMKNAFKGKIMDTLQARHLLYLIAEGELTTTKTGLHYGKRQQWEQKPGIHEKLAAIRLDYKLSQGWKRDVGGSTAEN